MSTGLRTLDTQIADLVTDLTGFHPALDRAVSALEDLAAADYTADQSQSVVAALGAFDSGNVTTLIGLLVRRISDPDRNAALAGFPDDRKRALRRLGAEYAAGFDDRGQQDTASEISAVIDETAERGCAMTRLTDDERKELSSKVAKANKQSTNRPR